jgi:hypothetical protein
MSDSFRTGSVFMRNFDQGVIETLGGVQLSRTLRDGVKQQPNYFLPLSRFTKSMNFPGTGPGNAVLITFSAPEDVYETPEVPQIVVRRGDHVPAPLRYHPKTKEYRLPSASAQPVTDTKTGVQGFTKYESKDWAYPYDIPYDLHVLAKTRGDALLLLEHVMRVYQHPASSVYVVDSLKEKRTYEAFQEGFTVIDELARVGERVVGFTVSIRVEGELDLSDPRTDTAATEVIVHVGLKTN